jgi:hypothetical protein
VDIVVAVHLRDIARYKVELTQTGISAETDKTTVEAAEVLTVIHYGSTDKEKESQAS